MVKNLYSIHFAFLHPIGDRSARSPSCVHESWKILETNDTYLKNLCVCHPPLKISRDHYYYCFLAFEKNLFLSTVIAGLKNLILIFENDDSG